MSYAPESVMQFHTAQCTIGATIYCSSLSYTLSHKSSAGCSSRICEKMALNIKTTAVKLNGVCAYVLYIYSMYYFVCDWVWNLSFAILNRTSVRNTSHTFINQSASLSNLRHNRLVCICKEFYALVNCFFVCLDIYFFLSTMISIQRQIAATNVRWILSIEFRIRF